MSKLKRNFIRHALFTITTLLWITSANTSNAQNVAVPYFSFGNGFGTLDGPGLTITQEPNSDIPVMSGQAGCCPELGYAFDLRLGVRLFDIVAIEGGVIGQGWQVTGDETGGTGFGGGGLRLYLLSSLEYLVGDLDLPLEVSIGTMFGYTVMGKDFAYTGSFAGFDGTIEYLVADFFGIAARANFFTPNYDNFVYTDFDRNRGRCLATAGSHVTGEVIHEKGSMACTGGSPNASFFAPVLVLNFYVDVF